LVPSQWWAFYIFSVGASGIWQNWTVIGAILLTFLFQGSTAFTEWITAKKYPLYAVYQKYTPTLMPIPFGESFEKTLEREKKKAK
jgi:steroid 5-alpha reductase family enzyme